MVSDLLDELCSITGMGNYTYLGRKFINKLLVHEVLPHTFNIIGTYI